MENKKVEVELKEVEKKDILEFHLGEGSSVSIDFNDKDQSQLRKLFYEIIKYAIEEPFELELKITDGYRKNLYIEIAKEYIKQLDTELKRILSEIPEELKKEDVQ
ncbi:MAG: hypothetical protein PHH04_07140 [Thomasclavelia sp.]|jgi:hypothetical protein|nr:hypothetical protein [Thomasclavelia sp.]